MILIGCPKRDLIEKNSVEFGTLLLLKPLCFASSIYFPAGDQTDIDRSSTK